MCKLIDGQKVLTRQYFAGYENILQRIWKTAKVMRSHWSMGIALSTLALGFWHLLASCYPYIPLLNYIWCPYGGMDWCHSDYISPGTKTSTIATPCSVKVTRPRQAKQDSGTTLHRRSRPKYLQWAIIFTHSKYMYIDCPPMTASAAEILPTDSYSKLVSLKPLQSESSKFR